MKEIQRLKQTFGNMYSILIVAVVAFCIGLAVITFAWYDTYSAKIESRLSDIRH